MKKKLNGTLRKIAAVLMAAVLIMAQSCFIFAAEEPVSEEAVSAETGTPEEAAEEPQEEEPVSGEPVVEETVTEEAGSEEAVSGETVVEETVIEEPEPEEAAVQKATPEEPVKETSEEPENKINSARINEGGSSIPTGAKVNLKEEFGIDSDYKSVVFTITSGKSCAELSGSTLIAKKAGEVSVKVKYKYDGEKGEDETSFTIYAVGFKKKSIIVNEKGEYDATQNMKGDLSEGSPAWSSSAETVATVDPSTGKVNVLAGGTTVISAEYSYGEKSKICKFKLVVKLPGFKVSSKSVKFGAVFTPKLVNLEKGTPVNYYLDSNETRAEFTDQSKGKVRVKGVATDESPILLHCTAGSEELTCSLTTTEPYISGLPKSYEEYGSIRLKKKNTRQLSVKGIAKGTPVTWSSSDDETVSVSSKGLIKAKQYGYATITATVDGYGDMSVDVEVPDPSDNEE
ncbi:MAG: Ig-like domain-containing protein [Lachnospiraceae bacterium]|nr:Ig-like domain-containing protein [Lachnospiraceae bacterium]